MLPINNGGKDLKMNKISTSIIFLNGETMKSVYISTLLVVTLAAFADVYAADSTLSVTCKGDDVGADVLVNGKFKGECPVDVLVPEGTLKLKVQKKVDASSARIFEQEIRMGDNVIKTVEVSLGAPQKNAEGKQESAQLSMEQAEAKKGSLLSVTCKIDDMDAEVFVDDQLKGVCPLDVKVSEGTLKLRVQKKVDAFNDRTFEQELRVGDGAIKKIEVQLGAVQLNAAGKRREPEQVEVKKGIFKDCPGCPEMIVIPAGSFDMGSPDNEVGHGVDEGPVHRVTLPSFALGKTEVTRSQYAAFVGETKHDAGTCWAVNESGWVEERVGRNSGDFGFRKDLVGDSEFDNRPVSCVNWLDAQAYVQWLSKKTGQNYRLPTEAEWEYAARAGTTTARYWGNDVGRNNANCSDCGHKWDGSATPWEGASSAPVGSFPPNAFGLYDMLGNVWEWTEDTYHNNYKGAPTNGSAWVQKISGNDRTVGRIIRGGSWKYTSKFMRSAYRVGNEEIKRYEYKVGFRLARTLP
jgi:formylglycine-generating enzyme required for sulfatase activity